MDLIFVGSAVFALLRALGTAFAMAWEILWPLILGFALSGVVQAVVSKNEMTRLLPDDRPRSIVTALALGAASSSCSYVAVALARSIFRKGADFTAAMAFEMASTNLVFELGIVMFILLGRPRDRKSTRLNSSHLGISYAVFCLKKKIKNTIYT